MKTQNDENNKAEGHKTAKSATRKQTIKLIWQQNSLQEIHPALMETIEIPAEKRGIPLL